MFMLKKLVIIALVIPLSVICLSAQSSLTIQGKVIDKYTGDPLPAFVSVKGIDNGSSADYDGTFTLILESTDLHGPVVLEIFQSGYRDQEAKIRLCEEILIEMEPENRPSHEVLVTADSLVSDEITQTTVALKKMDIYTLPGTAADPLFSSQVLPGVNSLPDSSSLLFRGGAPDEVAYYYDGIEVANPFLTGTLHEAYFSIFNNQEIDGFRVSTSGFHAKYGDALSGVMDISTKDAIPSGEGGFGLSILGLNSYIGLPLKMGGTFVANYNRGHSGLMTRLNNREESEFETEHAFVKFDIKLNKATRLRILGLRDNYNYAHDAGYSTRSRNIIGGFSLTSMIQQNLVTTFTLSRVSHQAVYDIPHIFKKEYNDNVIQARSDTSLDLGRHYLEFGADIQRKNQDYFFIENAYREDGDVGGTRIGIYFSDKFRVADLFYLTLGGRINTLTINDMKMGFAPRFSLTYFLSPRDILRFTGGYHQQSADYFPLQTNDLSMKHAKHLSLTYDRISENLDLRLSLYNKQYGNLFLFEESIITNNGKGFARGVELFIKRKYPKYDAFFVYNFLSSKRKENDVPVLTTSPYEIKHSFTGIFRYKFKSGTLDIRFSHATGLPYTPLVGRGWDEDNDTFFPIWGPPFSERYPSYQRLDINGSKNITFFNQLFVVYFGVMNVLDRKNILRYDYNSDYSLRYDTYSIFGRSIFIGICIPFF